MASMMPERGSTDSSLASSPTNLNAASPWLGLGTFVLLAVLGWEARHDASPTLLAVWGIGSLLCASLRSLALLGQAPAGDRRLTVLTSGVVGLWIAFYWIALAPNDDPVAIGICLIGICGWWASATSMLAGDPASFTIISVFLTLGPLVAAGVRGSAYGGSVWLMLLLGLAIGFTYVDRRQAYLRAVADHAELRSMANEVTLAFASVREGVMVTEDNRVTRCNPAMCSLLRRDVDDVTGRYLGEVLGEGASGLRAGTPARLRVERPDGSTRVFELMGRTSAGHDQVVWSCRDVTDEVEREAQLRTLVGFDDLTGVANRRSMLDLLHRTLAQGAPVALFVVDVDNFKAINDRHGHAAGDQVLRTVARRLEASVGPAGVVTRFGGDEFVVVLTDPGAVARRQELAAETVALARSPITIRDVVVVATVSVGVAHTSGEATAEQVLQAADRAMYQVKRDGRSDWRDADADGDRLVSEA